MDFNSHARVGRDGKDSIRQLTAADFNSHARVGRDWRSGEVNSMDENFNSHARVGRDRRLVRDYEILPLHFNSHARVGRDGVSVSEDFFREISTHTPV